LASLVEPAPRSAVSAALRVDRPPWGAIVAFLLPAFTVYLAFTAYPVVRTLWNSVHTVLPRNAEFVGFANFAALARDDLFWRSVRNTFVWACVSPLAEVTIGLLLALALYARIPGRRVFRIAGFTPVLMS
jgi:ABC-type sugar transport system permease subunit